MSPKSIKEYTVLFVKRYKRADYNQKKKILDEYCKVTGYHRKHAIRKLNHFRLFVKKKKQKRGRKSKYNQKPIITVLKKIWLTAHLPCSKILKSLLPFWLPHYIKHYGHVEQYILDALETISPATIDRIYPYVPSSRKKDTVAQNQDLYYATRSPSKQANGKKLSPVILNPIPSITVVIMLPVNMS